MPIVPDKYRNTTTYHIIYKELITAARYRGTITYQEIAVLMGLPLAGNHMGKETGHILGEISEDEVCQGRPKLSAVAVGTSGRPGEGFFGLAKDIGKIGEDSPEQKLNFWKNEKNAVYQTWKLKLE